MFPRFTQQAFILCAGKGTRLGSLTTDTPKCLVEVGGIPVIDRIINWLGVGNIIINLSWHAEKVQEHFQGLSHIRFSLEDEPLGTAGGIRKCYDLLDEELFVIYGDVVTNMDLRRLEQVHRQNNADLTMVSYHAMNPQECGILIEDGDRVLEIEEKPAKPKSKLANGGILMCRKSVFLEDGSDIATHIIPNLLRKGRPVCHTPLNVGEWLIDMGTKANYDTCCRMFDGGRC